MQDMLQNNTQVETVNFRLYFKVIRQNEIQYFAFYYVTGYILGKFDQEILSKGRGFIGYPKGRNRDIKIVN